jgi:hypothetical protein
VNKSRQGIVAGFAFHLLIASPAGAATITDLYKSSIGSTSIFD